MHLLFSVHPLWVKWFILFVSTKETEADGIPAQAMLTRSTRVLHAKGSLVTWGSQKCLEEKSERDAVTSAQLTQLPMVDENA